MSSKKFVIISYPRTGSTFLTLKLNSASNVLCYSEVFHKQKAAFDRSFYSDDFTLTKKSWLGSKQLDLQAMLDLRNKNHAKFLDLLWSSSQHMLGFKIFPGQHDEALKLLVDSPDVKKIFLIREDMLRNYVSYQIAMTHGKWDRMPGQEAELQQVDIDAQAFLDYANGMMNSISALQKRCDELGQAHLDLSYENITTSLPLQELSQFLGLELEDIDQEVARKRQNPFALKEMISNFGEVSAALEGSSWAKFLEQ